MRGSNMEEMKSIKNRKETLNFVQIIFFKHLKVIYFFKQTPPLIYDKKQLALLINQDLDFFMI